MTYTKEREDFFAPPKVPEWIPKDKPFDSLVVGFKRLSEDATIPTKAFETDSGFDICASADVIIEPGATVIVPTDIALDLPAGYEAQIRPRSGVTAKTKLRVQLGTIDNGFTGALGVICDNIAHELNDCLEYNYLARRVDGSRGRADFATGGRTCDRNAYLVRKGDKVAQLVITQLPHITAEEVWDIQETARGGGGFGSTGYSL